MSGLFDNLKIFTVKVVGMGSNATPATAPEQDHDPLCDDGGWTPEIARIAKTQQADEDSYSTRGLWNL